MKKIKRLSANDIIDSMAINKPVIDKQIKIINAIINSFNKRSNEKGQT